MISPSFIGRPPTSAWVQSDTVSSVGSALAGLDQLGGGDRHLEGTVGALVGHVAVAATQRISQLDHLLDVAPALGASRGPRRS